MPTCLAEIRLLNADAIPDARSLLYQAYRHDSTFAYVFESHRAGYEQRVRAFIREQLQQHFADDLPAIGLVHEQRLMGIALITPPQLRVPSSDRWAGRMRMMLTTGFSATRRYLDYQKALHSCLNAEAYHLIPLLCIHPQYQGLGFAEQLLDALHSWCCEDASSLGVLINTGNAHYLDFYRRQGYQLIGEVAVGPIVEHLFCFPCGAHAQTA